jgi:hypothetical protein
VAAALLAASAAVVALAIAGDLRFAHAHANRATLIAALLLPTVALRIAWRAVAHASDAARIAVAAGLGVPAALAGAAALGALVVGPLGDRAVVRTFALAGVAGGRATVYVDPGPAFAPWTVHVEVERAVGPGLVRRRHVYARANHAEVDAALVGPRQLRLAMAPFPGRTPAETALVTVRLPGEP